MGLENIRGGYGRCPPFLVGSLIIICFILIFNWWSLSAQNYDIIKQLEDLGDQLKLTSDELERCDHQRGSLESRNKNNEDELAKFSVRYEQEHSDAETYKKKFKELQNKLEINLKELDEMKRQNLDKDEELKTTNNDRELIQSSFNMCDTELASLKQVGISKDTTIETLRIEIDKYKTELKEQKSFLDKMTENFNAVKKELEEQKIKTQEIPMDQPSTKSDGNIDVPNQDDNGENTGGEMNEGLINDHMDETTQDTNHT